MNKLEKINLEVYASILHEQAKELIKNEQKE